MPYVSVIMPVYNAELYLDQAIKSVCNQTFQDFELLLVNDCSLDSSLDICEQWKEKDSRIRVISLDKNSGSAHARNVGLDIAIGKYLAFIDSDDEYDICFLERMVEEAEECKANMVWCNYDEISENFKVTRSHNLCCEQLLDKTFLMELFFYQTVGLGSMWNKIYRRDVVEHYHLRLNEERIRAEDWEFNLYFFQKAEKIITINDSLYSYKRQNAGSIMASYRKRDFELMCHSQNLLMEIANEYHLNVNNSKFWGVFV